MTALNDKPTDPRDTRPNRSERTEQNDRRTNRARIATLAVCLLVLVSMMAGCGTNSQWLGRFERAQEEGKKAETQAQYENVARLYEKLLDDGAECGPVYFNLGNAYMNAGKPGRAVAAYRQAQRYWPTHSFLDHNLKMALGKNAPKDPSRPLIEHLLFWQNWTSYPGKFHLAATVVLLTFALGLAALFTKDRARLYVRRAAWTGLVLSGLFIISATYDWYRFDYKQSGVVIVSEVIGRKGNDKKYDPAFTNPLSEGVEFHVRQTRGDWMLIELPGGQKGWIPGTAAEIY